MCCRGASGGSGARGSAVVKLVVLDGSEEPAWLMARTATDVVEPGNRPVSWYVVAVEAVGVSDEPLIESM